jgi:DNA-directed RNA polymerase II subunit RPB2
MENASVAVNGQQQPEQQQLTQGMTGEEARSLAADLIHTYFTSQLNPLTRHHIESFDQFLGSDLPAIIAAQNPITILKNPKNRKFDGKYFYKAEIYIGGLEGNEIFIGTPTIQLEQGQDVRILYPNEARLRNLTYSTNIEVNVLVRVSIRRQPTAENPADYDVMDIPIQRLPLCSMPLMLHSKYCVLNGKPASVLAQMGECTQDQGGYFIVGGNEKVLITRQEGAFNTLWITKQNDPNVEIFASVSSLNPESRDVKRVSFYWTREVVRKPRGFSKKSSILRPSVLEVGIPMVLKPIPVFVLFRALGVQTDKEILELIFPDAKSPETALLADMLIPSINSAAPFLDTYSAVQYIKTLTKGFSEFHVLNIIHKMLFPHVEEIPSSGAETAEEIKYLPKSRAVYLAECVRKILRAARDLDVPPSRDDTRHQRLLTSGFLCQMQFQNIYKDYAKLVRRTAEDMYAYNESVYTGSDFAKIFGEANRRQVFQANHISQALMRGFRGKWRLGAATEEAGVLQELSRLSYLDFVSHLRRAVLHFDTSMKLQGPRRLHPSQYGYFCTSETPSGSHIGITKNLSIMDAISIQAPIGKLLRWLVTRGSVVPCEYVTPELSAVMTPVSVNAGVIGYTAQPKLLARALRLMKRSGFLPPLSSSGFNIPERRVFIYTDDGRPLRPLICCEPRGSLPTKQAFKRRTWRDYVVGLLRPDTPISSREFVDPLEDKTNVTLADYISFFEQQMDKLALIEYIDPYEQNEALIANYPEHMMKETTHMEVHPSTILGLLGNMIPYPNHNQSPRNQLSASQSKQGLSLYATNWNNRFDNTANVLCYGQAPICRTIYQNYIGDGMMSYGQNIILAMGMYGGYNQEDGIIMNADALARGQFRSLNYRSYETYEEDEGVGENKMATTRLRIGNPKNVPGWLKLNPRFDYSKLDDSGIVREGEYVDQNTVIVGRYQMVMRGAITDASLTPQVWTRGRVEKVVVTVNNAGLRLVKVRVVQDRVPELGDKFSNRHGQKGTLNVLYRGVDMPRTVDGITPDMIMNPTAIPSRMTIGQILEMMYGQVGAELGAVANTTAFMNDGSPHEILGAILEKLGIHKMCNQVLYNGMTGEQIQADIYMGVVYGMRLKHMTEDKWNARGFGRREQRTHQPTGGRGNEGGMKLGELERDAIIAHGVSAFQNESYMLRSDGTTFVVCNGCGTIPIYNTRQKFYLCPMCDGPIQFSGETSQDLEPIPPPTRSAATFSTVSMPYVMKLFTQELNAFANIGLRVLTTADVSRLKGLDKVEELAEASTENISLPMKPMIMPETHVPELPEVKPLPTAADAIKTLTKLQEEATDAYQEELNNQPTPVAENTRTPVAVIETKPESVLAATLVNTANQIASPTNQTIQISPAANEAAQAVQAVQTVQTVQAAQAVQATPTAEPVQTIELAPASTAPAPLAAPVPPVEAKLEDGTPIISIDTSPEALAAQGLTEPKDGRVLTAPPQAPAANRSQFGGYRAPRSPRRSPSPQNYQQQQQNPYEEPDEEPPAQSYSSSAPLQVIKLG